MPKEDRQVIWMFVLVLAVLLACVFLPSFYAHSFCIPAAQARFTSYRTSDFFTDEHPAIWYRGALYPFKDSPLYNPQPYIAINYGEARWAKYCPDKE